MPIGIFLDGRIGQGGSFFKRLLAKRRPMTSTYNLFSGFSEQLYSHNPYVVL